MFEMKQVHFDLLKRTNVRWNDEMYLGAPSVDLKRPYGNSDPLADIAETILGDRKRDDSAYRYNKEGELLSITDDEGNVWTENDLLKLHQEMDTVIQIVFSTQSFVTGKYFKKSSWDDTSWTHA